MQIKIVEPAVTKRSEIRKPKIVLSTTDHDRLLALTQTARHKATEIAEYLQAELSRARLVASSSLPPDVVAMGSSVTYQVNDAPSRTVKLVYPAEADIDAGLISILTPIGAALLGLSPGQTMPWKTNSGEFKRMLIVAVQQNFT